MHNRIGHATFQRPQLRPATMLFVLFPAALLPARAVFASVDRAIDTSAAAMLGGQFVPNTKQLLLDHLNNVYGEIDVWRQYGQPTAHDVYPSSEGTAVADGHAVANSISLGASASAQRDFTYPPNYYTSGEAVAYLKDTLSAAKTDYGTQSDLLFSYFQATFSLVGSLSISGDGLVQIGAAVRLTDALGEQYTNAQMWTFDTDGSFSFGLDAPLELTVYGPITLNLTAPGINPDFVTIEELLWVNAVVGVNGGSGTASADFLHTMQVSNIQFFDADGQVVPDVQLVGANGDVYPYNVPEPASLSMVLLAGFPLLTRRSFRHRA